jgi:hypothetical protein
MAALMVLAGIGSFAAMLAFVSFCDQGVRS